MVATAPTHLLRRLPPRDRARQLARELARRLRARKTMRSFERYADDPSGFAREVLGIDLWERQRDIVVAVRDHVLVVVRSGQKTGKSISIVVLALWWFFTRPRALVVITSGNAQQVKGILWRELRKAWRRAGGDEFFGMRCPRDPATGIEPGDGRAIYGLTAADAERMSGYSGDQLLVLIDEASSAEDEMWEAFLGNLGGGGHAAAFGNPTRQVGPYRRAIRPGSQWFKLHIDSRESPNVRAGRAVVPGLAMPEWVEAMRREYGEDSPAFQARVAGNPPTTGDANVIPQASLELAHTRWTGGEIAGEPVTAARPAFASSLEVGVDVARFGSDDSVVQGVRGLYAYPLDRVHGQDTVAIAGLVVEYVKRHRVHGERVVVKVDESGVGAGVVDLLRAFAEEHDLTVVGVNAGASATADGYVLLRDQLWFGVRAWIDEGGALPPDEGQAEELIAPTYAFDVRQRRRVESKDEMKRKLGRSPDRADALGLALLSGVAGTEEIEAVSGARRETASLRHVW